MEDKRNPVEETLEKLQEQYSSLCDDENELEDEMLILWYRSQGVGGEYSG